MESWRLLRQALARLRIPGRHDAPGIARSPSGRGFSTLTGTPRLAPPAATPGTSVRSFLLSAITQTEKPASQKEPTTPHTVKLRGAPFNVTEVRARNRVRQGAPGEGETKLRVPGASVSLGLRGQLRT